MEPKYIDIHSHLNLKQFDDDREYIIQKLKDEHISTITVGVDYDTSLSAVRLAEDNENLFACVGLHPTDAPTEDFDYQKMLELASHKKVVAIGECGLDYFRNPSEEDKQKQIEIFNLQIKLALEINKVLMIHARPSKGTMDAYMEVLDILESYKKYNDNLKANFHFFAGDLAVAKRAVGLGFTLSFDGPITFTNDYDEIIKGIPMSYIMTETDSPFAAPMPYRGKRADPSMVIEVVKRIAEIKNLDIKEASRILVDNAKRIFDI